MTIDLGPELEAELAIVSERSGRSPEELILRILRRQLVERPALAEARDDWERQLRAIATDCGVSIPDSALGRDEMYNL